MTITQADIDAARAALDIPPDAATSTCGLEKHFAAHREAAEARAREDIEAKLRNVISHATGGSLDDTTLPLNEIAVRISAFRTRLWNDALAKGREEGAKAMQWQDIATAPKDGTAVDLWTFGGARWPNARWSRKYEAWVMPWKGEGWIYPHGQPTHWMPLPVPPALDPAQIVGGKP